MCIRKQLPALEKALVELPDLNTTELCRLVMWLPKELSLYLALCSQSYMTDSRRLLLLSRAYAGFRTYPSDAELLHHIRTHHPVTQSLHDTQSGTVISWSQDILDDLCLQLGGDLTLQRVAASLLATWTGTPYDLLQTASGIGAETRIG